MANEAKVMPKFSAREVEFLKRGIEVLKASIKRAANTEMDSDVKEMRLKQYAELESLQNRLYSKEMFE